jgi:hypothetical protein
MPARPTQRKPTRRRSRRPPWEDWPDHRLLDLRLSDLGLEIERSRLASSIRQVYRELARRGIRFRPHFWLAEEWFSPDGIPGVAVPFYLAHPRLMQLERRQMLEVEGGTQEGCMRLLRHEVGHALDHAYLLHRRRKWQRLFGKSSQPYPTFYMPRPYSKQYVLHLDFWYAQSHPDEDFAETFAVWLRPRAIWRKRYQGWPALKKLEYVDSLMQEIAGQKPAVISRARIEPLARNRKTLRQHYDEKRSQYEMTYPLFYDQDLRRLFSDEPEHRRRETAAAFLRRIQKEVRQLVSRWTSEYEYSLDQVLKEMIVRCRDLKLHVKPPQGRLKLETAILLTVQTMNYLHSGRHRVEM